MQVTIHYPEQLKVSWLYSETQLQINSKPKCFLKKDHIQEFELQEGDVIQANLGLVKSNKIVVKKAASYEVRLSGILRYTNLFYFFTMLGAIILINSFDKTLVTVSLFFGAFVLINIIWVVIMLKGKHLKIVDSS